MRKLMLLAAMVALALVAAAPAVAQPLGQGFGQEDVESGDVEPAIGIASKGDQVNMCAAVLQAAQSGNVQNAQGVLQYKSAVDEIEFEGSRIAITPELVSECQQTIQQSAAAGPKAEAKAGKAVAKAGEAKAGKAEAKAQLPKTGGVAGTASLLGLGAGALLVAGGLLTRKMIR